MVKQNPISCAFAQDKGMQGVLELLKEGKCLSGVDLSAATDTLNAKACIRLIENVLFDTNILEEDRDNPVSTGLSQD